MSRIRDLVVLLTCIVLLALSTAMYVRQVAEQAVVLDALTRLQAAESAIASQRIVINALAVGQRSNGQADARVFTDVGALKSALSRHVAEERYRFGLTVSAMGAGR